MSPNLTPDYRETSKSRAQYAGAEIGAKNRDRSRGSTGKWENR